MTRARNAAWLAVWTALAVAAGVVVVVILEALWWSV